MFMKFRAPSKRNSDASPRKSARADLIGLQDVDDEIVDVSGLPHDVFFRVDLAGILDFLKERAEVLFIGDVGLFRKVNVLSL